ncbi:MAG: metal-dependent transcriptional regulator [Clostridiales bacterium]|nr:metal-dependent transcriptional regulator [Clostridiales bacterium]
MVKEMNNYVISEAMEEYLEAIYTLSLDKPAVRITDIAIYLGLSKPSVNRAVNSLKRAGLVEHEPYGDIILTPYGATKGEECYCKHKSIVKFLIEVLRLERDAAEHEACKIEHSLSRNTVDKMVTYMTD